MAGNTKPSKKLSTFETKLKGNLKKKLKEVETAEQQCAANIKAIKEQQTQLAQQLEHEVGQFNAAQGAKKVLNDQLNDLEE